MFVRSRFRSVVASIGLVLVLIPPAWAHSSSYKAKRHGSEGCRTENLGGEYWLLCYESHYNSGNYHNHVINHFIHNSDLMYWEYRHKSHAHVYSFNCIEDPCLDLTPDGLSHLGAPEGYSDIPPPPIMLWPPRTNGGSHP